MNFKVKIETGLHARPAALLVNSVANFKSKITIEKQGREANLKSLLSLLSLGVNQHDEITIRVEGSDEDEAVAAIIKCGETNQLW